MESTSNANMTNDVLLGAHYIPRPRVNKILERATRGKLVYVIAGEGYGKTQAVRGYIERQQQDAVVRWVQLTESDNIGSRYWEHLTHNISHDNPDLADRLREFGFPETLARFKQFAEILKSTEHRSHKTFLVLDDFHLINSKQALTFAERCAHLKIPGACVIIISRTEPQINAVALFAKEQADIVTEDELRFTNEEISDFLMGLGIPFPAKSLPRIADSTKGWALAVRLLSMVLKKTPDNFNVALDTMKKNVFKLMETEAFNDFPENVRKTMVRLSLISDLPLKILWEHFDDSLSLQDIPQLASFVWFDSFTGHSRVHPLYWEFLESKQNILTDEEKQDTYRQAAQWCLENNFYLDAVKYLANSRQFDRILEILLSYPFKLPYDSCEYFLGILENLNPAENELDDPKFLLLINLFIPLLLSGTGKYEVAREKCFNAVKQWENSDKPIAPVILGIAYSNLAYIDMYTCTVTHKYDAPEHLKKSQEYFEHSPVLLDKTAGAFSVADIRSFACLVGEGSALPEFDQFLDMARLTAKYVARTSHNMYYGYDDLVACELSFYKNQPEAAKNHANEAILKAREKNQHSIEAMAAMYLFRVALAEGDYLLIKELFRQSKDSPETPNFWNRRFLYELGIGFMYAQIGLPNMVPPWLAVNDERERENALDVSVPVREVICVAKYYLAVKKYNQALAFLCGSYPANPHERFLLGELTLSLLTAAARIRTGDTQDALRDFEKAYSLSFEGVFETPFIELGKDLLPLTTAALEQINSKTPRKNPCNIPEKWLKTITRKASVYAKKTAVVLNSFKSEKHIEDAVQLSRREREVLKDLYHGLSREEIATNRYLSVNTVHKIIQSIFIKLDANNKADAIRIAVEKNMIE